MGTQTAPLGLRLFLEGVEVPIIAAQVSIQKGQASAASIQIIPLDAALLFLPRTSVHLFYLDNEFIDPTNVSNLTTTARDAQGMPARVMDDANRFTVADEQYKLLFSGEVIGYNYTKTPTARSMLLQCLDFSSYWDTCYQWYAEYAVGGNGLTDQHHNFVGAGQYLFNDVAAGTRWVISNILNSKPESPLYKNVSGLLGGYIHLLEVIGGLRPSRRGGTYKAFRGVNDFFTIAELLYNLSGMLGAVQSDKTSTRMFAAKAFRNWLRNGMASAGSLISFRDTLRVVGQYIFHDTYPNPAAYYVPAGAKIRDRVPKTVLELQLPLDVLGNINDVKVGVQSVIGVLDSVTTSVRMIASAEMRPLKDAEETLLKTIGQIESSGGTDAARLGLFARVARTNIVRAWNRLVRLLISGVSPSQASTLSEVLGTAVDQLDRITAGSSIRRTVERNVEEIVGEHLFNQLLLPETFFVAPPRCNVLFPDMYFNFSYGRNFLREVSRLACQGGIGMIAQGQHSGILGRHYFAPNIKDAEGKWARRTVFSSGTVLMPHEVHSGIIPRFEWVTDGHRWGVNAAKGRGKLTKGKKIAYVQRLANFQFFMHRWSARSMNAQARFNPHMVIGFPGVIIDRSTPSVSILVATGQQLGTDRDMLPSAYVGKVASLMHNVNQGGGTTSIGYTHCRTHRGIDDEFLGILEREFKEVSTDVVEVVPEDLVSDLLSNTTPDLLQLQLLRLWIKGRLVKNTDLTVGTVGEIDGESVSSTSNPDPYTEMTSAELDLLGVSNDDYLLLRSRQSRIRSTLDDPDENVRIPSRLTVEIVSRVAEGKILSRGGSAPFEEAIRPGWYSPDVWDNENISSKVYLPLLGTTAITDDRQVGDPEQFADLIRASIETTGISEANITVETEGSSVVLKVDNQVVATLGFNLETGTTTETAIDGLTALYGILKKQDLDVQSFIDDYVKRPVANLVEILGDSDFQLGSNGEPIARDDGTVPFEGFHSRAFGPYNVDVKLRASTAEGTSPPKAGKNALLGLIPSDKSEEFNKTGTVIDRGRRTTTPVPAHLDPRGRAQARVLVYAEQLSFTRGILAT